jgi:hypothetical protein
MGIGAAIIAKAKEVGEGISTAFTGAGDGISSVIDSAKGQIPPEYQGEIEKIRATATAELKKLEINTDVRMTELAAEAQKTVYDFTLQYEGRADQVPGWILILRTLIRPSVTIIMVASMVFFMGSDIFSGTDWMNGVPAEYWWMLGIVLTFWFGGKAVENSIDRLRSGGGDSSE